MISVTVLSDDDDAADEITYTHLFGRKTRSKQAKNTFFDTESLLYKGVCTCRTLANECQRNMISIDIRIMHEISYGPFLPEGWERL